MILQVSREAPVKIASHAWNVFPLECFGILLGRSSPFQLFAALPVSHTEHWREPTDRWTGVEEKMPIAEGLAATLSMHVIGFYAATEDTRREAYPLPPAFPTVVGGLFVLYHTICCKSCSCRDYNVGGRWLAELGEYRESKGKRLDAAINQRRILALWTQHVGHPDYSNHAETEYPRLFGVPLPSRKAKATANKALHATSEPAPGAASSSHEG